MKICVVNITPVPQEYLPNSKKTVDACCARVVKSDTQLEFRAPAKGPLSLPQNLEDYRNPWFQHLVVHETIKTVIDADKEGFDAIVVNCFDDPGVKEARSLVKTPVFGLLEPTFHYACQLGAKLGALVPDMPGQVNFVQAQIDALGLSSRMINNGVRAESKRFTDSFAEALQNPQAMVDRLTVQSKQMVDEGADVIVIACGGLGQVCGLLGFQGMEYKNTIVPIVNPLTTAVKTAEMMIEMQRGLGTPIPSLVNQKRLSGDDIERIKRGFGITF
jgi:allantoin racemase